MTIHQTASPDPATDSGLVIERSGAVARLRLNRPQRANALSSVLVDALIEAVATASGDGTRLMIFEGQGGSFCSGFDLSDVDTQSDGDLALRFLRIEILLQNIYHAPMPTVALAQGRVFGAGADLFGACSVRIAAPDAKFRFPGPGFGLILGTGRLGRCIGEQAAQNWLLSGREFDAAAALDVGFATEILDPARWPAHIAELGEGGPLASSTIAAVLGVLKDDSRAKDLAALARSVAPAGLKDRILRYRDQRKSKIS
jgi:enoyl-CoA hydratase/carnithine racemase